MGEPEPVYFSPEQGARRVTRKEFMTRGLHGADLSYRTLRIEVERLERIEARSTAARTSFNCRCLIARWRGVCDPE